MSNSLKYLTFLFGIFCLQACSEDYLETTPIVDLTTASFYSTEDQIFDAVVGCYDGLQKASGGDGGVYSFYTASEVMSDDCFGGAGNSDDFLFQMIDEFDQSRSPGNRNVFEPIWKSYYSAIARCNVLIQNFDNIDWSGREEIRDAYLGEARFLRAFLYYDAVRLWGNIPLLTEPSDAVIAQAPAEDVYAVIAEDLEFAAEHLPESYDVDEFGRATKWAAKSMLARVFLYYTGYYETSDLAGITTQTQALQHVEDVINNSGHSLLDDFSRLWPAASVDNYAGETNPEIVFSVRHTFTSDYNGNTDGNHWLVMFGMREFSYTPYGNGWGITVNSKLYDLYEETDTRRNATIISVEEEEIPFGNEEQQRQREYTGFYNKKYTPMSDEDGNSTAVISGGTDFQIGQFQDYVVMRYSDVLLMAAELGSGNAQSYFNTVRERAYGENYTPLALTPTNLLEERHREFALEGIRYWDLLRQGINFAAGEISETTTLLNGGVETTKVISESNIIETKGLSQIPVFQINLSGGIYSQNAGWQ